MKIIQCPGWENNYIAQSVDGEYIAHDFQGHFTLFHTHYTFLGCHSMPTTCLKNTGATTRDLTVGLRYMSA